MDVIKSLTALEKRCKNSVLAIGVFDGVHRGHQHVIRQARAAADKIGGRLVVVTFYPHPVHVLRPEKELPLVTSLKHRLKLIERLGADACFVVPFTKRFARLSPEKFIKRYLVDAFCPRDVFVGDDFRFGRNRQGDCALLKACEKKYRYRLHPVKAVKMNGQAIGSTAIRRYVAEGKLKAAEKLLGRKVSLSGQVIHGESRGKHLGFRTANLQSSGEVIPPRGVYLVNVILEKRTYHGMANIGFRPSFHLEKRAVNIEVHIFDFNRNIYGREMAVEILKKMRDEIAFASEADLVEQIKKDEKRARDFLLDKC